MHVFLCDDFLAFDMAKKVSMKNCWWIQQYCNMPLFVVQLQESVGFSVHQHKNWVVFLMFCLAVGRLIHQTWERCSRVNSLVLDIKESRLINTMSV